MACVGLILQSLAACEQTRETIAEGDTFPLKPLATLPLLGGTMPDLSGKTLLINFWATWCEPCREEMPYLQQLSERLDPARYAVLGVSVDEDANLVREFLLQYRIAFANLQDAAGDLATSRLGLDTYPQTFVVTPQGIIERRIDEAISRDTQIFGNTRGIDGDTQFVHYRRNSMDN